MRLTHVLTIATALTVTCGAAPPASAQTAGTPVFTNLAAPVPPNVVSQGFQCCQTSEIGDEIALEPGTPRRAGFVTVLMSSWSLHAIYPDMPAAGYEHPITLNLYTDAASAEAHAPAASITQTFTIPWRPEADPTCGGTAWRAGDGSCYSGYAFTISFDLRSLNYTLPDQFIYGVAYNTNTWGYEPIGAPGPYESLNVGIAKFGNVVQVPTVGVDVDPDVVYWNTRVAAWYSDGGAGGIGTFRADTGWVGYPVGATFTTFAIPATSAECTNGAWQNLVRADFTPFKNQGDCVSYTNTGQ